IKKAFEIANTAGMSEEELEAQFKRHDFIYLQKNSIEFALKQGIEQGIQQGLGKGKNEKAIEIAKTLLSLGDDIEKISKATGLPIGEVKNLANRT
ncbi:MAG: transposase, partial [bacterium]